MAGKDSPPVTWLLPVKNGMPYLAETLASIAAQTYANWEVLAWDNGSTDGTVEELRRWIPVRLPGRVVADRPLTLGNARAHLVQEAPTEFCAWIDADDISAPERLEHQVRFLLMNPEVAAVGSHIIIINADGHSNGVVARFPLSDDDIVRHMLHGPGMAQPAVLFRRSAVLAVGNYRDVGPVHVEDYDLWLRLAVNYRLANLDEPLLHYRVHDRSTTVASEKAGILRKSTTERFLENAPALYGCSPAEAKLLAARGHACAILVLFRIAKQLKQRSGVSTWATLRSPEFIRATKGFIGPQDVGSRLAVALLDRSTGSSVRREFRLIGRRLRGWARRRLATESS